MKFNDLLTQDLHDEGAELRVIDPATNEPSDSYIKVVGTDSKVWQALNKKALRKVLSLRAEAKEAGVEFEASDDELLIDEVERLVDATIGWRGFDGDDGQEMPFSKESCKILYTQAPNIRDQVNYFIGTRANFIKG